jgi:hypothetical protein
MEQIQNEMRANQGKVKALADRRGIELAMKAPQLMDNNMLEPTEPMKGGSMDMRMKRIVGGRKKKVSMEIAEMEGGAKCGCAGDCGCGGSNGYMAGGAREMGRSLAEQMAKLHGPDFMKDFMSGLTASGGAVMKNPFTNVQVETATASIVPKVRGGRGVGSRPPSGQQVGHARMSSALAGLPGEGLGGQDVPPGGEAPMAYGSAPQAPASFQRNTVGMGRSGGPVNEVGMGRPAGAGKVKGKGPAKQSMLAQSLGHKSIDKARIEELKQQYAEAHRAGDEATKREIKDLYDQIMANMAYRVQDEKKKMAGEGAKKCGGAVSKKGREDERLAMEVKGLKDKVGGAASGAGKGKRSARGQAISRIMKSKGMTLPQASKYLKEHPEEM